MQNINFIVVFNINKIYYCCGLFSDILNILLYRWGILSQKQWGTSNLLWGICIAFTKNGGSEKTKR